MADDLAELGTTGLRRTGTAIIEEFVTGLHGIKGARTYREMADNDPVIGSILYAIEKIILRLDWRVDQDSDSPTDLEAAQFIEECLHDMSDSWDATLQSILSMLTFGWSYHELVYKRRGGPDSNDPATRSRYNDGKIGWRKWPVRAQETLWGWQFDEAGGTQAMIQMDPYNGAGSGTIVDGKGHVQEHPGGGANSAAGARRRIAIPIDKALLFRTTYTKGNPEGRSLLRNAYRPWWYKRRIEEIEAIGIERDLAGLPVAYVPAEYLSGAASPAQQQVLAAVQDIVTSIKRNEQEGVVMPAVYDDGGHKMFDLTLLSAGGQRQFDTDKVITRYDQRIAMSVLSDFILLGHDRVGSFALGSSKIDLWTMAVEAIAKAIAEVVNTHAIPRLLRLNAMQVESMPRLVYGEVSHIDLTEVSEFVQRLAQSGALTPDERLEEYLRGVAGLPPAEAGGPGTPR